MAQDFWFNLPVKDLEKTKQFYRDIGFKENPSCKDSDQVGSFYVGNKQVVMMLFPEDNIKQYASLPVTDTSKSIEVLLNIDAQSREEVDVMAETVKKAGGTIYTQPTEMQGWMYGLGFVDPDGHRWIVLHMDYNKMESN